MIFRLQTSRSFEVTSSSSGLFRQEKTYRRNGSRDDLDVENYRGTIYSKFGEARRSIVELRHAPAQPPFDNAFTTCSFRASIPE